MQDTLYLVLPGRAPVQFRLGRGLAAQIYDHYQPELHPKNLLADLPSFLDEDEANRLGGMLDSNGRSACTDP